MSSSPRIRTRLLCTHLDGRWLLGTLLTSALLLGACPTEPSDVVDAGDSGELKTEPTTEPGPDDGSPDGDPPATVRLDPPIIDELLPFDLPPGTGLKDLGVVSLEDGVSRELELKIDPSVGSFVIIAYGHPGSQLVLHRLEGPGGALLVDDAPPSGLGPAEQAIARGFPAQFFSPNRAIPSRESGAFLVPSSPDVALPPGVYRFQLGAFLVRTDAQGRTRKNPVDQPIHVVALLNRAVPRSEPGTLDLALWFTGAGSLSAESAPTDPALQEALDVMREAYAEVGVILGDIAYLDLEDPSLRTVVLGDGCEGGDLDALSETSGESPYNRLNIFFIERFHCALSGGFDIGQGIGGISSGIPGIPYAQGTTHSGVAVSTAFFLEQPGSFAIVLAHETGHFLGLYHTEEGSLFGPSGVHDPISDTAESPDSANNLMYFTVGESTALTPGQGFVMKSNPWVTR